MVEPIAAATATAAKKISLLEKFSLDSNGRNVKLLKVKVIRETVADARCEEVFTQTGLSVR